jgi:hypothetical protein
VTGDDGRRLGQALADPLARGDLEEALSAARRHQRQRPGDPGAAAVVEALEQLLAQVWYRGADAADDEPDPRFALAAEGLARGDLAAAEATYAALEGDAGVGARATRLAHRVRAVQAALSGATSRPPLENPATGGRSEAHGAFEDERTRAAGTDELPLRAFEADRATTPVAVEVPPEALPSEAPMGFAESTQNLKTGDYVLVDEATPGAAEGGDDAALEERTRVYRPAEVPGADAPAGGAADPLSDDEAIGLIAEEAPAFPSAFPGELVMEEGSRVLIVEGAPEASGGEVVDPDAARAPAVPRPPATTEAASADAASEEHADDVHAPLEDTPVVDAPATPAPPPWSEPAGAAEESEGGGEEDPSAASWVGFRSFAPEPTDFRPGTEGVDADSWAASTAPSDATDALRRQAEDLVAAGRYGEALGLYQDLAADRPDDRALWARVEQIARMLQRRSEPPPRG